MNETLASEGAVGASKPSSGKKGGERRLKKGPKRHLRYFFQNKVQKGRQKKGKFLK